MTPLERRTTLSLTSIYALRMLGLFLVLPVFALEARKYPGGDDAALVGLGMGIYGLTQGLLQIPFGMASDKLGRKRVIVFGLLMFAVGSFTAAAADSLLWLIIGRSLQGAGAISAATSALVADQTRDEVRTKAMAVVGASIALMFALSLVAAPPLAAAWGLSGLFVITGVMALVGVAVMVWGVPPEGALRKAPAKARFTDVLKDTDLLRLDLGVFVLNAVQLAMWVAVPVLLVQAGLDKSHHWWVYLPAVFASFFVMWGTLFKLEKKGYLRAVFLWSIGVTALVELGFVLTTGAPSVAALGFLLFAFFCGFNILEACLPSMVSRLVPSHSRGAALGVYNMLQSFGLFAGGAMGGFLVKTAGMPALFATCAALVGLWLLVSWGLKVPQPPGVVAVQTARASAAQ
jgi:MFS family permease